MRFVRAAKPAALLLAAVTSAALLTACQADDAVPTASGGGSSPSSSPSTSTSPTPSDPVQLSANVRKGERDVPVDRKVAVQASAGRLTDVTLTGGKAPIKGTLAADGSSWTADELLEPDTLYVVKATGSGEHGGTSERRVRFRTMPLALDQQTYPSVAPLDGETVGVGMPVVVTFDVPVTDKKTFEKHMTVTSQPAQ